jgi:hypothetical protein
VNRAGQRGSIVHIAGNDVQVGAQLRQRCAWCGALVVDYELDRIAVPEGQDPRPATWPVGGLVEIDGNALWFVPHNSGDPLPANACAATGQSAPARYDSPAVVQRRLGTRAPDNSPDAVLARYREGQQP